MSEATYQGLSERARYIILGLGAVVAILNLLAAWYFAIRTGEVLQLQAVDIEPYRAWLSDERLANIGAQARYDLTARAMHAISYGKLISNKQSLVLVCFGASFALSAIGFALFVIGADGAFKVSYNESKKTGIVLTGTAPGLLCFIISGWLVYEGITQRSELKLPPLMYEVPVQDNRPADAKSSACEMKDMAGTCYTQQEWKKKFGG